jgi:hypothetical protein
MVLTNAIDLKYSALRKYQSKGIVSQNDIFIIAVNDALIPSSKLETGIPWVIQSILSFGNIATTLNLDTMEVIEEKYEYRGRIVKTNGESVPTNFFLDTKYSYISGILCSKADLWNRPNLLGADFTFAHNPLAVNPIERKWLSLGKEYWVENDTLRWETLK